MWWVIFIWVLYLLFLLGLFHCVIVIQTIYKFIVGLYKNSESSFIVHLSKIIQDWLIIIDSFFVGICDFISIVLRMTNVSITVESWWKSRYAKNLNCLWISYYTIGLEKKCLLGQKVSHPKKIYCTLFQSAPTKSCLILCIRCIDLFKYQVILWLFWMPSSPL